MVFYCYVKQKSVKISLSFTILFSLAACAQKPGVDVLYLGNCNRLIPSITDPEHDRLGPCRALGHEKAQKTGRTTAIYIRLPKRLDNPPGCREERWEYYHPEGGSSFSARSDYENTQGGFKPLLPPDGVERLLQPRKRHTGECVYPSSMLNLGN